MPKTLKKLKKVLSNKYFKICISALIIGYFLITIDSGKVIGIFNSFTLFSLVVILLLSVLRNVVGSFRFEIILDKRRIPFFEIMKQYFIASFYNNVLPTAIGGDAVRMIYLKRFDFRTEETIGLIGFERIIGLYTEILLAFICCHFWHVPDMIRITIYALFGLSTLGLISIRYLISKVNITRFSKLYQFLLSIINCLNVKVKVMLKAILASLLFQTISVLITIYIAVVLGLKVDWMVFFTFLPLIWIFTMIPISFGGVGLREVSFVYLFNMVGYTTESSVAISLGTYASLLMVGVIGAVILLVSPSQKLVIEKNEVLPNG